MTKHNPLSENEKEEMNKALRMYVLVRRDVLPLVHCGVQATHAVAEYVHYHDNDITRQWVEKDKTLIVLEGTEKEIEELRQEFLFKDLNYQPFYEPDMDNTLTAMAFQPISKEDGDIMFKHFKLVS